MKVSYNQKPSIGITQGIEMFLSKIQKIPKFIFTTKEKQKMMFLTKKLRALFTKCQLKTDIFDMEQVVETKTRLTLVEAVQLFC